ncbi:MAG: histidine ammonia-lyase [Planctomycetota bacterium]
MEVTLTGKPLTIEDVVAIARRGAKVTLAPEARGAITRSRSALEATIAAGGLHYGVNTGFGSLARRRVEGASLRQLQINLLRSHAAGIGPALPDDATRGMLVLAAASLSRGLSGVRPVVVDRLLDLLNTGITPVVPEIGSVGASGDLAPLAHAALVLAGEGFARLPGALDAERKPRPGAEVLQALQLEPIELDAKEGLALINGTHLMASRAALACDDAARLLHAAELAAAMSIDACRATNTFLDERVYTARAHAGPKQTAANIRAWMAGSQIVASHRANDPRVQDPYSLRCAPIVLGAARDAIEYVRARTGAELGAVSDNPLVFPEGDAAAIISAGNFHGMPIAIPLDTLAIPVCHIAGISERRVYHMLSAFDPESNLNPFLSPQPGLHSGLMIVQYTAAAVCNELIGLASPASVVNLSTSAGMEDYNSFGPRSAAKVARAIELAMDVIAIELLCAAQAIDAHRNLRTGDRLERAHALIRERVPTLTEDRPPSPDISTIADLIRRGAFAEC